jgi:hypothetical protein
MMLIITYPKYVGLKELIKLSSQKYLRYNAPFVLISYNWPSLA